MSSQLIDAMDKFSDLLWRRFMISYPTSEDWIRYAFYMVLSDRLKIGPLEFSFEVPFSSNFLPSMNIESGCKLDALITFESYFFAFEIKFLRAPEKVSNSALPANTGLLLNDINRLSHINSKIIQKYMLYVTDDRFNSYMAKPRNKLDKFYQLCPNTSPMRLNRDFIYNHCGTFIRNAKKSVNDEIDCDVQAIYSKDHNSGCHIRLLKIL